MLRLSHVSIGVGLSRHLVILPGLLGQANNWKNLQHALLRQLGLDWSIHALDMRNHGRSPHAILHSRHLMALDCQQFCSELPGGPERKIALLGHSMGGKVAMEMALTMPGLVERLLVVDVGPWNYSGRKDEMGIIETHLDAMRAMRLDQVHSMEEASQKLVYAAPEKEVRNFLLTNLEFGEDGRARWSIPLETLKESIPDIRSWTPRTEKFLGPTLFLGGGDSKYLREEMRETILGNFPNAKLEWIPGASHWVQASKSAAFIKESVKFLKS